MTTALFIGRFQPFHLGHLHVIKEALKEADNVIIGIAYNNNADKKENPFSVEEREEMINMTLHNNDISNFEVVDIEDCDDDEKWIQNVESKLKFDVVYMSDKNTFGEKWVERCLKDKYTIRKIKTFKGIDATIIREKIRNKENWKSLVPREVAHSVIKLMHLKE
jgi:nicotinamide-nucleotide adenylyltransferase